MAEKPKYYDKPCPDCDGGDWQDVGDHIECSNCGFHEEEDEDEE